MLFRRWERPIELFLREAGEINYTKIFSRRVLGSMNDLAYNVKLP